MDPMEDPEQIAKLLPELLVTLYESRATSLGEKKFMVRQAMSNMTFETDEERTHMFRMVSEANGVLHEEVVLLLYRNEISKRLMVRLSGLSKELTKA
jgi:hypothetical protein